MSSQEAAWSDRRVSAKEAVSLVAPGDSVLLGSPCATPLTLLEALQARAVLGSP